MRGNPLLSTMTFTSAIIQFGFTTACSILPISPFLLDSFLPFALFYGQPTAGSLDPVIWYCFVAVSSSAPDP